MSAPNACAQDDAVCMQLTGETPATTVEYVAVSAQPFAASVEIALSVAGVVLVLVLLRLLALWARDV